MTNSVLSYLEKAATKHPGKVAVAFRDDAYTYEQLRQTAQHLGYVISEIGVCNKPVAVFAERSVDTIAYFFAALYSGNYYVPIDPNMPLEKIASIFEDAEFSVVLGPESGKSITNALDYTGTYFTKEDQGRICAGLPHVDENAPVYMVYTSGSTGKPKGVLKSHKAVISYIESYCKTFAFSEDEVIGNQTPFFFDASAKDIYLMLKLGCKMEILPSTLFSLPPELIDYLNTKKVTFASWVPTVLSLVAQLNPFSMVVPETLRKLFFVGEVMPMKHLNKWRKSLPNIQYVNLYGSSEIAGICCYHEVVGEYADDSILPMGKPLGNCKIYLMDQEKIITEPNQIGEMYLVSDSLALEYFHDPEKTQASFLIKDFGEGPIRCFKTGDLAQYDSEGNLLFASRTDSQIKHMGHRIELGEIEAVANALPEINRCCCLYQATKKKLILFCELSDGSKCTGQEIRSILRGKLSDYMLPAKVNILEHMPLNANGKIDRQFLKTQL